MSEKNVLENFKNKNLNINSLLKEQRPSTTIIENKIKILLGEKNNEKIILSNLSSKIWIPEEISKLLNELKDNEISNKFLVSNNEMENNYLKIRKFTIISIEDFKKI